MQGGVDLVKTLSLNWPISTDLVRGRGHPSSLSFAILELFKADELLTRLPFCFTVNRAPDVRFIRNPFARIVTLLALCGWYEGQYFK